MKTEVKLCISSLKARRHHRVTSGHVGDDPVTPQLGDRGQLRRIFIKTQYSDNQQPHARSIPVRNQAHGNRHRPHAQNRTRRTKRGRHRKTTNSARDWRRPSKSPRKRPSRESKEPPKGWSEVKRLHRRRQYHAKRAISKNNLGNRCG